MKTRSEKQTKRLNNGAKESDGIKVSFFFKSSTLQGAKGPKKTIKICMSKSLKIISV